MSLLDTDKPATDVEYNRHMGICHACPTRTIHNNKGVCGDDGLLTIHHARAVGCPQKKYEAKGCLDTILAGVKGVTKAITGFGGASPYLVAKRKLICAECPHATTTAGVVQRCTLCGCMLWAKLRNADQSCPVGKWGPAKDDARNFGHTGDLGDLVYALPVIRELGGGTIYVYHDDRIQRNHEMNARYVGLIKPLLELQPYIERCEHLELKNEVPHRLDSFRGWAKSHNLIECHYRAMDVPYTYPAEPWLTVDRVIETEPVIFSRSFRHQNERGGVIWNRLYAEYGKRAAFIGLESEHRWFERNIGPVPFIRTADLLEAARVIAGCKLFCGNQSSPFAIAEALRKPTILEVFPGMPNCSFPRADAIHLTDVPDELPPV